jgi:hypothetical protein
MRKSPFAVYCVVGLLMFASGASVWAISSRALAAPANVSDIAGTYELTRRVMSNGDEIRPPAIVALYTMDHGRGNFNLFVKNKDGTLASESTISRYILTAAQYCEWIVYTTRNNLDGPGLTNEAPPVTDHCARVISKDGRIVFAPPGEGVESRFDKDGFTAIIPGQFVDHWRKVQ